MIMDGRAIIDIDSAICLETCTTLEEAKENLEDWDLDAIIVLVNDNNEQEIII